MLENLVYIELDAAGIPRVLIQHQDDALRVFTVEGDGSGLTVRLREEVGENADFEPGENRVWFDRQQIHVHRVSRGKRLVEQPDLTTFWSRATILPIG